MVQFWGKEEVRRASVQVAMVRKFWVKLPRAERPVSTVYFASPPPMNT